MEKLLIKALSGMGFMIEAILALIAIELALGWLSMLEAAIAGTLAIVVLAIAGGYGWIVGSAWIDNREAPKPHVSLDWLFAIQMPRMGHGQPVSAQARYQATVERLNTQWTVREVGK